MVFQQIFRKIGKSENWKIGNSENWKVGKLANRKIGNAENWKFGKSEIRNIGNSENREFEKLEIWKIWKSETRKFGKSENGKFGKSENSNIGKYLVLHVLRLVLHKFGISENRKNRRFGKTEIREIGKSERKGVLNNKRITGMSVSCFFTLATGYQAPPPIFIDGKNLSKELFFWFQKPIWFVDYFFSGIFYHPEGGPKKVPYGFPNWDLSYLYWREKSV